MKYYVWGWGGKWYVVAKNHRTVCECYSKSTALRIAKLLREGGGLHGK